MVDTAHLLKRGNTYSAVLEVPKPMRAALGTRRFVEALGTSSLAEANKRKLPHLIMWRARIEAARKGVDPDADVMKKALEFRAALQANDTFHDHEREASNEDELLGLIDDEARELIESRGRAVADRFRSVARASATYIKDTYPLWIAPRGALTRGQHDLRPLLQGRAGQAHRAAGLRREDHGGYRFRLASSMMCPTSKHRARNAIAVRVIVLPSLP